MDEYYPKTPIRIPVKFVQGKWEYFYGGSVPVKEGAVADLIVQKHSIADDKFLAKLRQRTEHRFFGEGTRLRAALTVRQPPEDELLKNSLIKMEFKELSPSFHSSPRPECTRFVEVVIGPPSRDFARRRKCAEGGVWLQLQGTQPKGIVTSSVWVPKCVTDKLSISYAPLDSLNVAFTRLSEVFEPWRQSHTGNVYTRFVFQGKNGTWYPLEALRGIAEAEAEDELLRNQWTAILAAIQST